MTRDQGISDLFHPAVALLYCGVVLVFSMAVMQPVYLALTFVAQLALSVATGGRRALRGLVWQAPIVVVLGIANPLFVSVGSTELLRIGMHAFYLEALIFGLCQGLMLVNVLLAFGNAARIVSSDKVLATLGNIAPYLSLVISMTMRLVPKFSSRFRYIRSVSDSCTAASAGGEGGAGEAPVGTGSSARVRLAVCTSRERASGGCARGGIGAGKLVRTARKAKSRLRLTTVLLGWGLEDSLESADAMRARGWGAKRRRTSYQRYHFRSSDAVALAVIGSLALSAGLSAHASQAAFAFYPRITGIAAWYSYLPYAALLALPLAVQFKEYLRWRR